MVHVGASELASEGLLNIENRAKQLCLTHMHKVYNDNCPSYLSQFFTRTSQIHTHNTRNNQRNFFLPQVKSVQSASFYNVGAKQWNSLPLDIKTTVHLATFKQKVKKYLLQKSITDELSLFTH